MHSTNIHKDQTKLTISKSDIDKYGNLRFGGLVGDSRIIEFNA